jgi:hypothetical protein
MVGILLGEGWELYIVTDGVMVGILLGEGWELYIVTDGVMVGILLGEGWELYIVTDGVRRTAPILLCFSRHWAPSQHVHIGLLDDGIFKCRNM